jgi:ABC-type phosphate/phosphonate transport system substrate-binding protein
MCSLAFGIFVLAAIVVPRSGAQPPSSDSPTELKIGFPKVLFKDVHPNLVQIAAQPFKDTIQKTAGVKASLVIADDYQILADQLKAKQLDIAVFHGFEFAWIEKSDPNLVPLVVTVPNCGKVQACLVVNSGGAVKRPDDLKGACVAVPKGSKAHCQMFLDRIREGLPEDRCCPRHIPGQTPEDVLDSVASDKSESALVDVSALLSYQADKPGLGSCLKVLKESILLPSAVVVCRKGALTGAQLQAFQDGLMNCNKTGQGRLFLTFWNLKGFALVNQDYYDLLAKCREAYPAPIPKK